METVTMPRVHKSGGLIGAEIRGLDLTREYPDETYQAILRAWAEHGVIFLRDQQLSAEQRDAFASRLGEIRVRQEVRKEPEQTKAIGEGWHTDMTSGSARSTRTSASSATATGRPIRPSRRSPSTTRPRARSTRSSG
jgi:alpha-ketoglutarate-dependent taurine dioxygenase